MKILVTGGAGYVGSTVAAALSDAGDQPVLLDDLSRGCRAFLRPFPSYIGDMADPAVLDRLFDDHPDIEAAVHCAARTVVSESLRDPLTYYLENVGKTVRFTEELLARGCDRLIFSSSAAVYGQDPPAEVTEDSPAVSATPYAASKLMAERVLADACAATSLTALALRYFNPIGCDPRLRSGPYQPSPVDALGSLVSAWVSERPFWIHGDDWDTPDGTPLRDFVHVWDVAQAIVAAAHSWPAYSPSGFEVVNVGSGRATSVRQLAEEFNRHVDRRVTIRYDGRRAGDIVGCYTSITKAQEMFGWSPSRTVADAIVDVLGWVTREGAFSAASATATAQREEPYVSDGSRRRGGFVRGGRGAFRAFGRHHSSAT